MEKIHHCSFSLFRLEKNYFPVSSFVGEFNSSIVERCFEFIETFDNLEDAKIAQKEYKQKSIILTSY